MANEIQNVLRRNFEIPKVEGEKPRSDTEGPPKMAQYASAAMMMGRNQEWAASQGGQQYLANSYQMAAAAGTAHPAAQQVI